METIRRRPRASRERAVRLRRSKNPGDVMIGSDWGSASGKRIGACDLDRTRSGRGRAPWLGLGAGRIDASVTRSSGHTDLGGD